MIQELHLIKSSTGNKNDGMYECVYSAEEINSSYYLANGGYLNIENWFTVGLSFDLCAFNFETAYHNAKHNVLPINYNILSDSPYKAITASRCSSSNNAGTRSFKWLPSYVGQVGQMQYGASIIPQATSGKLYLVTLRGSFYNSSTSSFVDFDSKIVVVSKELGDLGEWLVDDELNINVKADQEKYISIDDQGKITSIDDTKQESSAYRIRASHNLYVTKGCIGHLSAAGQVLDLGASDILFTLGFSQDNQDNDCIDNITTGTSTYGISGRLQCDADYSIMKLASSGSSSDVIYTLM